MGRSDCASQARRGAAGAAQPGRRAAARRRASARGGRAIASRLAGRGHKPAPMVGDEANAYLLEGLAPAVALAAARPAPPTAKSSAPVLPAAERATGIEYAIRDVVAPARELEKQGHQVLKLNIGDPVAYGFRPPANLVEALHQAALQNLNGYAPSEGDPVLVDAIVRRERRRNKADYAAGDVLVTTGISEGLQMPVVT